MWFQINEIRTVYKNGDKWLKSVFVIKTVTFVKITVTFVNKTVTIVNDRLNSEKNGNF